MQLYICSPYPHSHNFFLRLTHSLEFPLPIALLSFQLLPTSILFLYILIPSFTPLYPHPCPSSPIAAAEPNIKERTNLKQIHPSSRSLHGWQHVGSSPTRSTALPRCTCEHGLRRRRPYLSSASGKFSEDDVRCAHIRHSWSRSHAIYGRARRALRRGDLITNHKGEDDVGTHACSIDT